MIIDSHIHIGSWDYPHYSSLTVSISDLNYLLDESEISGALVFPTDQKKNKELLEEIIKNGRKKYWFIPWIDPKDGAHKEFLEMYRSSICGIKVHASLDEIYGGIMNPIYLPVLEFAKKEDIPLIVHCGRRQNTASYKYVIQMAKKFPEIDFIMCHLGGDFEKLKLEAPMAVKKENLKNVYFDISATRESWTIEKGIQMLGAEKFLFASDYPIMHPQVSIKSIKVLNLTEQQQELIFHKNLLRIFKKKPTTDH